MPDVLDWQLGDPRLALQRAVQDLTAGKLVVFPTEVGYHAAASAMHPEALAELGRVGNADESVLAVRNLADALRWAPWMSQTARRLGRRCWPGPVTFVIDKLEEGQPSGPSSDGIASSIRLQVPAHEALLATLEQLAAPLVVSPIVMQAESVEQLAAALGDKVALLIADGRTNTQLKPTVVHIRGEQWKVLSAGTITGDMLQSSMLTTIVFVCTGNTCRSPLAEGLCKKLLAERLGCLPTELPQRGFLVLSAGLAAMMGSEAASEAVEVGREYGADLSAHRSQPLTADVLARADYLFTMTGGHLRAMLPFVSQEGPQLRLLAGDGSDVPDPIGCEREVYRECAGLILRHLQNCLQDIRPL